MRIIALLIFWTLPLVQGGGHEPALRAGFSSAALAEGFLEANVINRASDQSLPADPITGFLAEDDDSLEDGSLDLGLSVVWQSQTPGRDNLSALAPLQHALLRIPSHPHPLRC